MSTRSGTQKVFPWATLKPHHINIEREVLLGEARRIPVRVLNLALQAVRVTGPGQAALQSVSPCVSRDQRFPSLHKVHIFRPFKRLRMVSDTMEAQTAVNVVIMAATSAMTALTLTLVWPGPHAFPSFPSDGFQRARNNPGTARDDEGGGQ